MLDKVNRIDYDKLEVLETLGEGTFGTVLKAVYIGEVVAIKTIKIINITEHVLNKFKEEIVFMAPLHHANLVRLIGACLDNGPKKLGVVLEFAENGSIQSLLHDVEGETTWGEHHAWLAVGTVRCLKYLHWDLGEPVIHRDIKGHTP